MFTEEKIEENNDVQNFSVTEEMAVSKKKQFDLDDYMENQQGALIPIIKIKKYDLERDALVKDLIEYAEEGNAYLLELKKKARKKIVDFIARVAKAYGVKLGKNKGNITLSTYKGDMKVQVAISDKIAVNEHINVAHELIISILEELTEHSDPNLRTIVLSAFSRDKNGLLSLTKLLELRTLKINHPKWKKAIDAIDESIYIEKTKDYIRFYKVQEEGGKPERIHLNMSEIEG